MHDYYAARAGEYDRIYAKPERQDDLRRMEHWLAQAFAGRTVLEVACGTGYWTRFYAAAARRAIALDAAEETLRIARGRVPAQVQLVQGDAYRLPAAGCAFDAAFAGFWWSHIPLGRIGEFLDGLHAALAPEAKVVFIDNRFVAGSSTPLSERDAEGNTYQTRTLADGSSHRVLKNFPSAEELLARVAPYARCKAYREWDYYWALEYTLRGGAAEPV